ncbi:MAG: hypothetical protein IM534_06855 [Chitinophagaceae bacterium]|nr:hypothetical protein [Chitinophagaceae bacterium]
MWLSKVTNTRSFLMEEKVMLLIQVLAGTPVAAIALSLRFQVFPPSVVT